MKLVLLLVPLIAALLAALFFYLRKPQISPEVGGLAPDFTLQDEHGAWRTLHEFRGKNVVLYFYPHDDTPGCTAQACSFRDQAGLYALHDIVVLGVSYDSPESHTAFKEKYHLPFTLLSDNLRTVAQEYGAQGLTPLAPNRITFLINPEGKIIKKLHDIDVKTYADTVLKEFGINDSD